MATCLLTLTVQHEAITSSLNKFCNLTFRIREQEQECKMLFVKKEM